MPSFKICHFGVSVVWSPDKTFLWQPCFQRVLYRKSGFLELKFLFLVRFYVTVPVSLDLLPFFRTNFGAVLTLLKNLKKEDGGHFEMDVN